jgi:hypothetical protein
VCVALGVGVKLVDQRLIGVDEFVDDVLEGCDGSGPGLKHLPIFDTLLVAFDDLVVPDAESGVAVSGVACNRLNKIFIVKSSSKSCVNLSIPEFFLLHFRSFSVQFFFVDF